MNDRDQRQLLRAVVLACVPCFLPAAAREVHAQAAATTPAPAAARVIGTVTSVGQNSLAIKPDSKDASGAAAVTVTLDSGVRVVRLAPGSTDLKSAEPAQVSDIAAGDRVLVLGSAGSVADEFNARRVVLMKSTAIAQRNEASEAEWQRGAGGIVTAMDPAQKTLTMSSGRRSVVVQTSGDTVFRRYTAGSVRFADAAKSSFGEVHTGDQLRVRGTRSPDGGTIQAQEAVSGSFENVSGTILAVNNGGRELTLKDLRTKRMFTVTLAETSTVRTLPAEVATRLAARSKRGAAGAAGAKAQPVGAPAGATPPAGTGTSSGQGAGQGSEGPEHPQHAADLNQVVARLPETPPSDLHKGAAVMIVGMPAADAADHLTAVTVLAGVEPILSANPNGESEMTLSPWNLGGGGADSEGGA